MVAVEHRKHVRGNIVRIHALYWQVVAFLIKQVYMLHEINNIKTKQVNKL
jgi:hypothetical protein